MAKTCKWFTVFRVMLFKSLVHALHRLHAFPSNSGTDLCSIRWSRQFKCNTGLLLTWVLRACVCVSALCVSACVCSCVCVIEGVRMQPCYLVNGSPHSIFHLKEIEVKVQLATEDPQQVDTESYTAHWDGGV